MEHDRFARVFETSYFVSGGTLILPVFSPSVTGTCTVFFRADEFNMIGTLIKTIAVLLVSEADRPSVPSLTEQFKRVLAERAEPQDALTACFSA